MGQGVDAQLVGVLKTRAQRHWQGLLRRVCRTQQQLIALVDDLVHQHIVLGTTELAVWHFEPKQGAVTLGRALVVARVVGCQIQQPLGAFHQSGVELLLQLVLHVPAHTRAGDDPQQCYPRQQGPRQRPRQAARFHGLVLSL